MNQNEIKTTCHKVNVNLGMDIETARAMSAQYGVDVRGFQFSASLDVHQVPSEAEESVAHHGGWYSRVTGARFVGEGELALPEKLLEKEFGPFDTLQHAAEQCALEVRLHFQN